MLRLSPKLGRVYRSTWACTPAGARRSGAAAGPRGPGLIGPAVRAAAAAWLEASPVMRQEAELEAAAQRDRAVVASAALVPLGRLLDALAAGAALPE